MLQKAFVRHVLKTAIAQGWTVVEVDDGEEPDVRQSYTPAVAVNRATATDEAHIFLRHPDREKQATLFIVWQGPVASYPYGEEAVCDYSVSMEPVMDAAYKLVGC